MIIAMVVVAMRMIVADGVRRARVSIDSCATLQILFLLQLFVNYFFYIGKRFSLVQTIFRIPPMAKYGIYISMDLKIIVP